MASTEFTPEKKAFREGLQLTHDSMKHLTTLSTGSIVIITTILEKLFSNPNSIMYIVLAIVLLLASILCSIGTMFEISRIIMNFKATSKELNTVRIFYGVALGCFFVGILLLTVFTYINLAK